MKCIVFKQMAERLDAGFASDILEETSCYRIVHRIIDTVEPVVDQLRQLAKLTVAKRTEVVSIEMRNSARTPCAVPMPSSDLKSESSHTF